MEGNGLAAGGSAKQLVMLLQIAWRNIWRNKIRSLVVISSIVIGLWAGIFILSFAWGMYQNNIRESVNGQLSHLQVHQPDFTQEQEARYALTIPDTLLQRLRDDPRVASVASRLITGGMVASPTTVSGVSIYGVEPGREARQIGLDRHLQEGSYFGDGSEQEIYIGEKLARKLKVKLRSKVVLTFTSVDSELISAAYRISGIYRSGNSSLDERLVYIRREPFRSLLGMHPSQSDEIAILLREDRSLSSFKGYLGGLFPEGKVEDWKDLAPELELIIDSFHWYTYIVVGLILLALTFGIVNTMLMSVLERVRELGMLMAIGMNRGKVFRMILLETLLLTLFGCPIGLLLGRLTVAYLGVHGIDLSVFSEGLESFGFNSVIYTELEMKYYWTVAAMSLATALLAAVYPAYRALKLNPAESIRKI